MKLTKLQSTWYLLDNMQQACSEMTGCVVLAKGNVLPANWKPPYWKVRMLRQRSLACRNYICTKIWHIIGLKSECSHFGAVTWQTVSMNDWLELERMKSWNSRTHVNEKFCRHNIYMFHCYWCFGVFSTYRYKCFDSFVFNVETPSFFKWKHTAHHWAQYWYYWA